MKIVAEDKLVEERTVELLQEWERKKPIHVSILITIHTYTVYLYTCMFVYKNVHEIFMLKMSQLVVK